MAEQQAKIPLPKFLKLLTGNNVPVPKAMSVAGKMSVPFSFVTDKHQCSYAGSYKEYNTPSKLAQLTEVKLSAAGVESKDDRKLVMTALRKSGHVPKETPRKKLENNPPMAGPSTPSTVQVVVCCFIIMQTCRSQVFSLRRHQRRRNGNGVTTSTSFCLMVQSMKLLLTEVWSSTKSWTRRFAASNLNTIIV
jgi:hypothetical protein